MEYLRMLVDDVDDAINDMRTVGFELDERWGPPFAIVKSGDLEVWLSGPGSSAMTMALDLTPEIRPLVQTHLVKVVESHEIGVHELLSQGWNTISDEVRGPGGVQQLFLKGKFALEVFQPL